MSRFRGLAGFLAFACACGGSDPTPPVVVPDLIAFQSSRILNVNHVFIMDDDGTDPLQLAPGAAGEDVHPVISPDGLRVAFSSNRSGHYGIYVVNTDNTGLTPVIVDAYENHQPSWSPDGTHLVFVRRHNTSGNPGVGLSTIHVNGTGLAALTIDSIHNHSDPVWSPDGTRIAYTGAGDIWVMNANGTGHVQLTTAPASERQAAWMGNATIVYVDGGTASLRRMNASDGSGKTNLIGATALPGVEPALSPDTLWVAYTGTRNGSEQILKRRLDGTGNEISIAAIGAFNSAPSWRARP